MAYVESNNKKIVCKVIGFCWNTHLFDAMRILKPIWGDDEGKYSRVDGIKCCCRKSNILPVYWECDINNYLGFSPVPISMNNLNKYYFDNICNFLEIISVTVKYSGANVSQDAHGLKVSLVIDGYFTKAEIRA